MEKIYNLEVDDKEANLIIQALAELPAKISMGLIGKLQGQASVQDKEKNIPVNKEI